jgi:hypothetical protein
VCVAIRHGALNLDGATDCIDRTGELNQRTVTCGFDNASSIFSNFGVNQLTAAGFERCECSFLVITYEAAVASNISRKDGGPAAVRLARRPSKMSRTGDAYRRQVLGWVAGKVHEPTMSPLGQKRT